MAICPKCNRMLIHGPRYVPFKYPRDEHLLYTCLTCGYSETAPTRDKRRATTEDKSHASPRR